ncbi:MAG: type IV pilus assembly protein FimV, partial [Burkholderiales bacterium]
MLKVVLLALLLPCFSMAAGLGELKVISSLGQPLRAEIDLVSMKAGELESLEVHIATPDAFRQAGIEYNPLLANVKLGIAARPDGNHYIKLSSSGIVNDPFLDVLIDLSSSSGQIEREYTMLFDPAESARAPAVSPPVSLPEHHLEQPKVSEKQPEQINAAAPATAPGKYGPVKKGDTLSGIALATKPAGVTLEQMLVALYRANSDAFAGKNMNRLDAGTILRIPGSEEIAAIGKNDAEKVVQIQAVDWNAYRQKLASGVTERGAGLKRSVSGKITAAVEKKPVAPQAQEVLKLSKGEASSPTAAEEARAAQVKTLNDASERILMLEKNIQEMKKLLDLKNKALASASAPLAVAKPAAETSLIDDIIANPVLLGAAGGVVLGIAGVGMLVSRRRKKSIEQDMPEFSGREERHAEPEPEKPAAKAAEAAAEVVVEADPLEEAQLYISYRRYDQAEEILKGALQTNPGNFDALLLLMKVHAASGEKDKLEVAARKLQAAEPSHEIWERAMEIGFVADPENPLYGGAAKEHEAEPPAAIELAEPESLDFDLGMEEAPEAGESPKEEATVDFDLSGMTEKAPIDAVEEAPAEAAETEGETGLKEEGIVDFDLASMAYEAPAETAEEAPSEAAETEGETGLKEEGIVDFDLASMDYEAPAETAEEAPSEAAETEGEKELKEEGIVDFDLASMLEEAPAETAEEAPSEAAETEGEKELKEEGMVDFDLSSMLEEAPAE